MRLLLIEDNPAQVFLIEELLRDAAPLVFTVTTAASLEVAEQHLDGSAFDLILTDLNLCDSTGLETVERLAGIAPVTPIVVTTGMDDPRLTERLMSVGACALLHKDNVMGVDLPRWLVDVVHAAGGELE